MTLWFQISPGSKDPIYIQIIEQVSQAIARGTLAAGDKLPPVRKLAAELVINPNTVAKAYTMLEQAGLVSTRTGAGTYILDPAMRSGNPVRMNLLCERLDSVISQACILGLNRQQITDLCQTHIDRFYSNRHKEE